MASQSTILALIKKHVSARKSEGAQLTAISKVLAAHGGKLKRPEVSHTRAGATGVSLRIYSFNGTKAGDFALITGPGVIGEVKSFTELDSKAAPKGFYVEAGAGGSAATKRVNAAMARAEAAAKRAASSGTRQPRKPRKPRATSAPGHTAEEKRYGTQYRKYLRGEGRYPTSKRLTSAQKDEITAAVTAAENSVAPTQATQRLAPKRQGMEYRAPAPKTKTRGRSHSGRTGVIPGASYKPVRQVGMDHRVSAPAKSSRRGPSRRQAPAGGHYAPVRPSKPAQEDDSVHMARLTAALRSVLADL